MKEGEVETSRHFLRHCLYFARLGLKHLGSHTYGEPGDIPETDIRCLKTFVLGSNRLVDLRRSL